MERAMTTRIARIATLIRSSVKVKPSFTVNFDMNV
jgi:hypothetical protein